MCSCCTFKGKGRTIGDEPKNKPTPPPKQNFRADPVNYVPMQESNETTMPGPGNRFIKVTKTPDGVAAKPPAETDEGMYKLTTADLPGMTSKGPKTFADVRKKPKPTQRVAKIKFEIRANRTIYHVEAMFGTNELIDAVYEFLETEVFSKCGSFEVVQTFPRQVLPRNGHSLISMNITGSTMLQVNVSGDCQFRL